MGHISFLPAWKSLFFLIFAGVGEREGARHIYTAHLTSESVAPNPSPSSIPVSHQARATSPGAGPSPVAKPGGWRELWAPHPAARCRQSIIQEKRNWYLPLQQLGSPGPGGG